ncbi:tRNA lysidine(34) synthetase TilS [Sphingomonas sinipercae]|uniref:tRNA(Ile)-lysidine synthase n=1 Tax=Sphingomonas sinipercae TaxID=2714944 RepID=A0A6G7ZQF6_9SPHN|nr:tRNA lysidine(34) synthetase TilS [Sphingomonas sinipercae]QIL03159.1 tRNA lysidine(34) synthetase TilS [Sphingomonas sinipercae]
MQLKLDPHLVGRFGAGLDRLIPGDARIGLAVSGGPDSLALLLLASAARPGAVEAATVDHSLRAESADEAAMVAGLCATLGVPHATLAIRWDRKPETALQERSRAERYRLLGGWLERRGLGVLATAHHLDDQVETLLMRLNRGAGVRGLAAIRPVATVPGTGQPLLRPLLDWRREDLASVCRIAGVSPAADPGNSDDRFERVRVRNALAQLDLLDVPAIGQSVANLAEADAALEWAVEHHWRTAVAADSGELRYTPGDAPPEIRRRIAAKAVAELASEGPLQLRGRELNELLGALTAGGTATLRGVRCSGGETWRFASAPPRRLA